MDVALVVVAAGFAVINGMNDGGTIVATGLRIPVLGVPTALLILTASVALMPVLIGTAVARTLTERLVDFQGVTGQVALLGAVVAAVGVVWLMSRLALPTSLTLALVGGITGAGWASGLATSWSTVAFVLTMAVIAPFAGAGLAFVLIRSIARLATSREASRLVRRGHGVSFGLQCIAYGANDGQKMLAVGLIGTAGIATTDVPVSLLVVPISVLFLAGTIIGLTRISGTIATGVLLTRPAQAVAAEAASATAVLASAAIGAPVSMTQAIAGGIVGSGISEGFGRIRWRTALNIVIAWIVTFPFAMLVAALLALAFGSVLA